MLKALVNETLVNNAPGASATYLDAYAQIVKTAGVDMLRVPYKGEAPSVVEIK